jgi:Holliday junction resolvase RusA-like endonuclease
MDGKGMKKKSVVEDNWTRASWHPFACSAIMHRDPDYKLELFGKPVSKKNSYSPMANGKGFFKGSKIINAGKMVALQIPGEYRDLKLENPHILFQLKMPRKSWRMDRDNVWTFYQDELKSNGVILDDSTGRFNGFILQAPVIESTEYKCLISIWRNE